MLNEQANVTFIVNDVFVLKVGRAGTLEFPVCGLCFRSCWLTDWWWRWSEFGERPEVLGRDGKQELVLGTVLVS